MKKLKDKIMNCHNTNSIFNCDNYLLVKDVKKAVGDFRRKLKVDDNVNPKSYSVVIDTVEEIFGDLKE